MNDPDPNDVLAQRDPDHRRDNSTGGGAWDLIVKTDGPLRPVLYDYITGLPIAEGETSTGALLFDDLGLARSDTEIASAFHGRIHGSPKAKGKIGRTAITDDPEKRERALMIADLFDDIMKRRSFVHKTLGLRELNRQLDGDIGETISMRTLVRYQKIREQKGRKAFSYFCLLRHGKMNLERNAQGSSLFRGVPWRLQRSESLSKRATFWRHSPSGAAYRPLR